MNGARVTLVAIVLWAAGPVAAQNAPVPDFSFFVTSEGSESGGNLGSVADADRHCQSLAAAVGAGQKTWRAYLSTTFEGRPALHARDRIGSGPWVNVNGVRIAENVTELHSENNNLTKETALTEKGEVVNGVGDTPNRHDILTGSNPDGTAATGDTDTTCQNWTSSRDGDSAVVGHHDRMGRDDGLSSWNSAHPTQGCSQQALESTGGAGLFYCFAVE